MSLCRGVGLAQRQLAGQDQDRTLQTAPLDLDRHLRCKRRISPGLRAVDDDGSLQRLVIDMVLQPSCNCLSVFTIADGGNAVLAFERCCLDLGR